MCKSKSFYFLKTFSLIIFILIISNFVYGQITIEERVEIEPNSVAYAPNNPASSHTIRIEIQWTPVATPGAVLAYTLPCQDASFSGFVTGGNLTFLVENVASGGHSFQFRFNIPCSNPQPVDGQYQLYLDDQLAQSNSFSVGGCYSGSAYPFYNFSYTPPLVSNFIFNLNNTESCILTPIPMTISTFNDCATGISWNKDTQPVNLTFTSGGEFASFYDVNSQLIGNSFSGTFSEFQDINIIQDSVYSGSEDKYFSVQCEWGGIVKTDSVKLHTQIGEVIVANTFGDDSLYTGQTVNVEVYPNDFGGGCTIFFPFESTYNAEIVKGNEYGNLFEPYTGLPVQSFTGLGHYFGMAGFNYIANGISPDVLDTVIIRVSTSDPLIPFKDLTLYIKPPPIYVYTVPEVLGADDTADVFIKHRLEDGTLEDFPLEQTFELAILDGCVNGNFLVDTTVNVYFADALQPIKFVTADSLDEEYDKVLIRVGTDLSGFMRPLGNMQGAKEKAGVEKESGVDTRRAGFEKIMGEKMAKQLAEEKAGGENPPIEVPIVNACALGNSTHPIYFQGDVITAGQPELVIIYPNSESPNEKITAEPKMPTVICKAQLKNYKGGQLSFEWKYIVTKNYERFTFDDDHNIVDVCPRIDTTVFKGISYSYNEAITEWAVSFIKESATFYYKGVNRKKCNQVISTYEGSNDIYTGGFVFVELTVKDKFDKVISTVGKIGNRIIGVNPAIPEVKAGLTTHQQITVYLESRPKWKHFNISDRNAYNKSGNPIYGYPNGFGLMQADYPPAKEFQLWNWKANKELGKSILSEKKNWAEGYPARVRNFTTWYKNKKGEFRYRDPIEPHNEDWYPIAYNNATDFSTDEEIWKETHQRYRGGTYWRWEPDDPEDANSTGKWISSPSKDHTRGDEAWDLYEDIQDGVYPDGWN